MGVVERAGILVVGQDVEVAVTPGLHVFPVVGVRGEHLGQRQHPGSDPGPGRQLVAPARKLVVYHCYPKKNEEARALFDFSVSFSASKLKT